MGEVTVTEVIERLGASIPAAAARIGVTRQTIYDWLREERLPAARLLQIHDATGIAINRLRALVREPEVRGAA